jgi:hypothetical protein
MTVWITTLRGALSPYSASLRILRSAASCGNAGLHGAHPQLAEVKIPVSRECPGGCLIRGAERLRAFSPQRQTSAGPRTSRSTAAVLDGVGGQSSPWSLERRSHSRSWRGCVVTVGGAQAPGRHGWLGAGLARCSEPACGANSMTAAPGQRNGAAGGSSGTRPPRRVPHEWCTLEPALGALRRASVVVAWISGAAAPGQRRPSLRLQAGQAPQPCCCCTRLATRICSARLALWAEPLPPAARQVEAVNCSPPE